MVCKRPMAFALTKRAVGVWYWQLLICALWKSGNGMLRGSLGSAVVLLREPVTQWPLPLLLVFDELKRCA